MFQKIFRTSQQHQHQQPNNNNTHSKLNNTIDNNEIINNKHISNSITNTTTTTTTITGEPFLISLQQLLISDIGITTEDAQSYIRMLRNANIDSLHALQTITEEQLHEQGIIIPRIIFKGILKVASTIQPLSSPTSTPIHNHHATKSSHNSFGRTSKPEHIIRGHTRPVFDIAFLPDGSEFFSASDHLLVWDATTFKSTKECPSIHSSMVTNVATSPSGNFLATVGVDGRIGVLSYVDSIMKTYHVYNGSSPPTAICFAPGISMGNNTNTNTSNGEEELVWGCQDGSMCFVQVSLTNKASKDDDIKHPEFKPHKKTIAAILFSTSRPYHMYTASHDTTICLTDISVMKVILTMDAHCDWVYGIVFTKDEGEEDSAVVSTGRDGDIIVWSPVDAELLCRVDEAHDKMSITTLASYNNLVASGGYDLRVKIFAWNFDNRKLTLLTTLETHTKPIRALRFNPVRPFLLSSSDDKTICVWKEN
jgi:WD40 repeat protein